MDLKWLITPTLARRLFFALFLANGLVWLALTYSDTTITLADTIVHIGGHDQWIGTMTQRAARQMNQLETDAEAVAFGAAWRKMFVIHSRANQVPAGMDWNGAWPTYVQVWRHDGQQLDVVPAAAGIGPLTGVPDQVRLVWFDGKKYLLYRFDGPKWSLRVALHGASLANEIGRFSSQLFRNLLLSFLVLALALLFAISFGLTPLRQLSAHLAQRAVHDLSPLGITTRYRELGPLLAALERLLLQLRSKVVREHAFLQDAAHELRTPLAVLSAQVYVLAAAGNEPNQGQGQVQQQIAHAMARATHLIGQLDALARVDTQAVPQSDLHDVVQLGRQELLQMRVLAEARQVQLTLQAPPALFCRLEKSSLQSILQNLLDNAIRYGARQVVLSMSRVGDELLCSVADDGPGIAPAERALVFERFYRSTLHDVAGAGLGLSIVQQAAARLHARLTLSEGLSGRGCCFSLSVPLIGQTTGHMSGQEPGQ